MLRVGEQVEVTEGLELDARGAVATAQRPRPTRRDATPSWPTVAVLGLGYVGLPTSLAFVEAGLGLVGIDVSEARLDEIRSERADLLPSDRPRLAAALANPKVRLTSDLAA